jgi:hypothetical protein
MSFLRKQKDWVAIVRWKTHGVNGVDVVEHRHSQGNVLADGSEHVLYDEKIMVSTPGKHVTNLNKKTGHDAHKGEVVAVAEWSPTIRGLRKRDGWVYL